VTQLWSDSAGVGYWPDREAAEQHRLTHWPRPQGRWADITREERATGEYQEIERVCALEVDHKVPLWSVAHLPPDERRPFFGPGNIWLLCPRCHKDKSRREAAERAAMKRAA
jgi:5-methylcytosine-specific restriction endonuclease McrA